jgi:hypothetical protein
VPPLLSIYSPPDDLRTNKTSVLVEGAIEPGAFLTVNERLVGTDGSYFSTEEFLEEGSNSLAFVARDRAGNTNSSVLTVTRDTIPPVLVVTSPNDGAIFNSSPVEVRGTTEAGATLRVNYRTVPLEGESFCITLELAGDGPNVILIEASDALNNTIRRNITVHLDTVMPFITIFSPADGTVTNRTTIVLMGRTEPGALLLIDGQAAPVDEGGAFSAPVNLSEGPNNMTVIASDRAGNIAQASLSVVRDTVVEYSIDSPENGTVVRDRTITVSGRAEPGCIVTVAGGLSARSDGTFAIEVDLAPGENLITLDFRDAAGNNATAVVNITRLHGDPGPPPSNIGAIALWEAVLAIVIAVFSVPVIIWRWKRR